MYSQIFWLSVFLISGICSGQDWVERGLGDPKESAGVNAGSGRRWELDWDLSDSFYYSNKENYNFRSKWIDYNPTGWKGPGETLFSSANAFLYSGNLVIRATRIPREQVGASYCSVESEGSKGCSCSDCRWWRRTVHTGYVSSRKLLSYPCFTEAYMKLSGTRLSSNFWLKSQETEIDVNESYGDEYGKKKANSNVHFFWRQNGVRSLNSPKSYYTGKDLTKGFNRYGVHWLSRTQVEFFFNGKKVRYLNLKNELVDPTGKYLNEGMRVIFDLEAHDWRGVLYSVRKMKEMERYNGTRDGSLKKQAMARDIDNFEVNHMEVDWVRTYRSVRY